MQRWITFMTIIFIHIYNDETIHLLNYYLLLIDSKIEHNTNHNNNNNNNNNIEFIHQIKNIFVLYLIFLTFLKDQNDIQKLKCEIKDINKLWQNDKNKYIYEKMKNNSDNNKDDDNNNNKQQLNEKEKQIRLKQFGIDEDLLLQSSSEYLFYTYEEQNKLKQIKRKWNAMKNNNNNSTKNTTTTNLIKSLYDTTEDDEVEDDFTFYRFLKARKWNVDKALSMYEKFRLFRKKENVSHYIKNSVGPFGSKSLLNACQYSLEATDGLETNPALRLVARDPCEKYFRTFCSAVNCGYTKAGSPIYIERTGEISPIYSKMMEHINSDEVVKRHIRQQELVNQRCKEITQTIGVPVGKQTLIFDLKGMSFYPNQAAMNVFKRVLQIDANYYPETLHTHFLINAPSIFLVIWKVVNGWLDPVTQKKFHIIGTNYQDTLLKHIDPSQLPIEYGGTNHYQLPHVTLDMDIGEKHAELLHAELDKCIIK